MGAEALSMASSMVSPSAIQHNLIVVLYLWSTTGPQGLPLIGLHPHLPHKHVAITHTSNTSVGYGMITNMPSQMMPFCEMAENKTIIIISGLFAALVLQPVRNSIATYYLVGSLNLQLSLHLRNNLLYID